MLKNSMKETGDTPSPQTDSVKKKQEYMKTSLVDSYNSLTETRLLPNGPQNSLDDNDTEYVIDKLVARKNDPKETFCKVRLHGYTPADNTLEQETNIPKHLMAR